MKNKKGFTLIELLAVIVILAIIALIATPTVLRAVGDARTRANRESARAFVRASESYCAQQLIASTPVSVTSIVATGGVSPIRNIADVNASGTQPTAVTGYTFTNCVVDGTATLTVGGTEYTVSDLKSNN
jgi:type IV pilus assembly protein PilA